MPNRSKTKQVSKLRPAPVSQLQTTPPTRPCKCGGVASLAYIGAGLDERLNQWRAIMVFNCADCRESTIERPPTGPFAARTLFGVMPESIK